MKIGLLLFFGLILSAGAEELTTRNLPGGSLVRLIAPLNKLPSGGFFLVRAEVENEGKDPLTFQLDCTCTLSDFSGFSISFRRGSDDEGTIESTFDFSCPPGEDRSFEFLIPVCQGNKYHERYLYLAIKDPQKNRFWGNARIKSDPADIHYGVSTSAIKIKGLSGPPDDSMAEFKPNDLPADWRAYAGYDALILTGAEFKAMAPGAKLAIDQWVRSGGHLIVLDQNNEASKSPSASSDFRIVPGEKSKLGRLLADSLTDRQDGFGLKTIVAARSPREVGAGDLMMILQSGKKTLAKIHDEQYHSNWKVGRELGSRSLGTGLVLFGLMIFAVVVGPVNLFVLAKATRRHRLFFTTPIISLTASLLMVGLIILSDGFGGDGTRAIAIEVGSSDDKTATVIQEQFSRSGILFSSGFDLDDQSVLNPVKPPITEMNRADSAYSTGTFQLQVSRKEDGWKYSGDLFESRSEQAQLIRSVIPSREGLALVSGPGESLKLASTFAYSVGPVFYTDASGEIWQTDSIAPGESATLQRSGVDARSSALNKAVFRFAKSHRSVLENMFQRKDSFAALAEAAPGVDTHPSIDWQESPVVITGLAKTK